MNRGRTSALHGTTYLKILLCTLLLLSQSHQLKHKNILIPLQCLNLPFQSNFPNFQSGPQNTLLTLLLWLQLLGL
jgi:hypothetical protein